MPCVPGLSFTQTFTKLFAVQVLHLLAMARAADIELSIDDFQMMADKTPFLADLMYAFHSPSIWIHLTKW